MTKNIITLLITTLLLSCSNNEISEYKKDGITFIKNPLKPVNKDFSYALEELYTVKNNKDSNFCINYPKNRAILSADIDKELNLYVVDNIKSKILKFNNQGKFIKSFGNKGPGPGEFPASPIDISIDEDKELIYVSDNSGRLSIFNLNGKFIKYVTPIKMQARFKSVRSISKGLLFLCETYSGNFGQKNFKMGNTLYNSNDLYEINKKIAGYAKPFTIKEINADDKGLIYCYSQHGNLYTTKYSKEKYVIEKYNYQGKKLKNISRKYHAIERSPEKIKDIEKSLKDYSQKTNGYFGFDKVSKFKNIIHHMFCDEKDNLWVSIEESILDRKQGQKFDIFDKNGYYIKQVKCLELSAFQVRSKKNYIIATTTIEENYEKDGEVSPVIKVFKLSIDKK